MFNNIIRRFNQYKRERFLKRLGKHYFEYVEEDFFAKYSPYVKQLWYTSGMEPVLFRYNFNRGEFDHPSLLLLQETERFLNEL